MSPKTPCPVTPSLLVDAEDCSLCNDEHKCDAECHGCCPSVIEGVAPFRCADCGDTCRDGHNVPREVAL